MTLDPALPTAAMAAACALGLTPVVLLLADRAVQRHGCVGIRETIALATLLGIMASAATAGRSTPEALSLAPVIMIALAASVVDAIEDRLPNALTAGLAAASVAAVLARVAVVGDVGPLLRALLAAVLLLVGCLLMKVADDDVIGWGDVKFAPALVAVVAAWRPDQVLLGIFVAVLLVGVSAAGVALTDRTRRAGVPYGPALLVGAVTGLAVAF